MADFDFENMEGTSQEDLVIKWFQSCKDGDIGVMDVILSHGVCCDVTDNDGRTGLILASTFGQEVAVAFVLKYKTDVKGSDGAGVDIKDNKGRTALMMASIAGHEKIVALLLGHGARVNMRDQYGLTALLLACRDRNLRIVEMLIENGADINMKDDKGTTPAMYTCFSGKPKIFELLMRHNADISSTNTDGYSALMLACRKGCEEIVKALLNNGADVNVRNNDGNQVLREACRSGNTKIVKMLIERGANVNDRGTSNRTALMMACIVGQERLVEILIECGADVNVRDSVEGRTALLEACRSNNDKAVKLLLDSRADPDIASEDGTTPLISACHIGGKKVVKLLLEYGANVNAQSSGNGRSTVMIAVLKDNVEILEELLKAGASLDLADKYGHTVFSFALMRKETSCLIILLAPGYLLTEEDKKLKPIHRNANNDNSRLEALRVTMEFGVFQWEWCPVQHLKTISLSCLSSGFCPGKLRYIQEPIMLNTDLDIVVSPLVAAFLENDTDLVQLLLQRLYYFPEDYLTLSTNEDIRNEITNKPLLEEFTLQPLSLLTWSFLTVSKCISIPGSPCLRPQRVNCLPIPGKFKRELNFHAD